MTRNDRYSTRRQTPASAAALAKRRQQHALKVRHRRFALLSIGLVGIVCILIARLTVVQVIDGSKYAAYTQNEIEKSVALPATRGPIYDRNGDLLTVSVPRADVVADDFQITHPAQEAQALAPLLKISVAKLTRQLSQKSGYVVLAKEVLRSTESAIQALNLDGMAFIPNTLRVSPAGSLFQPILGGVNAAGHGDASLEYSLDNLLGGKAGSEVISEAPGGVTLPAAPHDIVEPKEGTGVALTIDQPLQLEVTNDVAAQMKATHSSSGSAVIEDVHTGAILAMVDLVTGPHGVIGPAPQVTALTSIYQPGSVMKLATVAASLQDGLISPTTNFSVPYSLNIDGYTFKDADPHPTQNMCVAQILAQSSNIGTIEISRLLGLNRLAQTFKTLGFGRFTGLNWPGESPGIVGSPSTWYGSAAGSVPIGTGVAVTSLQVLDAYNAVANGGVAVTPHIIGEKIAADGSQSAVQPTGAHRVLSAQTVATLVPMLEGVVQDGTAVLAKIPGYTVAGKTGTAQVPESNGLGYVPGDWNATFVGFVPAQNPQLSGIVWLNHPTPIYGGTVAAPVFSKIMGYALRRFDIAPPSTPASGVPSCAGSNLATTP